MCPERKGAAGVGREFLDGVAWMMRVWPLGVAVWTVVSNRLVLGWLKTVVVSVQGKGARGRVSGGDREDE